jgi:transcriptional regulator with XRE-family HTH domain
VAAGLSQEALAERARMSARAISDLERGVHRLPYKDTVAQLATALGMTATERAMLEAAARSPRDAATAGDRRQEGSQGTPTPLLTTKLTIPQARPVLVPRPRLTDRLHAGLQGPLTLVAAPAGYGKTTLLSAWRATPAGSAVPLAWVSLGAGDNDPVRFWSYILTALDRVQSGRGAPALALLQSPQPPPIEAVLATLLNALSAGRVDMVLLLSAALTVLRMGYVKARLEEEVRLDRAGQPQAGDEIGADYVAGQVLAKVLAGRPHQRHEQSDSSPF